MSELGSYAHRRCICTYCGYRADRATEPSSRISLVSFIICTIYLYKIYFTCSIVSIAVDGKNNNWDFDALISMYDFVQLTPEVPHRSGWAFSKEIFERENWSVEFFFRIVGTYPADGMAFWFVEERFKPGNAFGYKENFKGLGVFFDTYKNMNGKDQSPWIAAMIGDGQKSYDHNSDGLEYQLAGCHAQIINTPHPVQAKVTYINRVLEVQLKVEDNDWEICFTKPDINLPRKGYIGFTAQTGGFAARHELLAVTTAGVDPYEYRSFKDYTKLHRSSSVPKAVIALIALSGVAGLGIYYFRQEQKRHNF